MGKYNNNRNYNRNSSGKKRTGCKRWNKDGKQGLTSFNCSKSKGVVSIMTTVYDDEEFQSKNGQIYVKCVSNILYKNSGNELTEFGLMNKASGKVVLKKLGWVLNPQKNYCGSFKK